MSGAGHLSCRIGKRTRATYPRRKEYGRDGETTKVRQGGGGMCSGGSTQTTFREFSDHAPSLLLGGRRLQKLLGSWGHFPMGGLIMGRFLKEDGQGGQFKRTNIKTAPK